MLFCNGTTNILYLCFLINGTYWLIKTHYFRKIIAWIYVKYGISLYLCVRFKKS